MNKNIFYNNSEGVKMYGCFLIFRKIQNDLFDKNLSAEEKERLIKQLIKTKYIKIWNNTRKGNFEDILNLK